MKPQLLESCMTGKEMLHLDQDTNGTDLRDALQSMHNGHRILAEMSLCEACSRVGDCFIYDLHASWRQRIKPLVIECRDYKEKGHEKAETDG